MDTTKRAIAFWIFRVAIAVLLVIGLQAWKGPDPMLWYLAAIYAAVSGLVTFMLIRKGK